MLNIKPPASSHIRCATCGLSFDDAFERDYHCIHFGHEFVPTHRVFSYNTQTREWSHGEREGFNGYVNPAGLGS